MSKVEDIIQQYRDNLSVCPICKSKHIVLEERLTRITVFNVTELKPKLGFRSKPIIHYEFRCSACRHVFTSETIDDGDWNVSWTLLGDIFAKKRATRLKAKVVNKRIQSELIG